jgi:maleate isomerase
VAGPAHGRVAAGITGWGQLLISGTLHAHLQDIVEDLLSGTDADRTTRRVDLPEHDMNVDFTAAEAIAPSVGSIRRDGSLDQRHLNTVEWLEQLAPLIQPHFWAGPAPPEALIRVYGVRAQMLSPIERGAKLAGWISVHSLHEREWSDTDRGTLAAAARHVHDVLDPP